MWVQQAVIGDDIPEPPSMTDRAVGERLFDLTLDLILVVERGGWISKVSPSVEAMLGYAPDEMVGRNSADFILAEDLERGRAGMRQARLCGAMRNFECRYVHKDGHTVDLSWTGAWSEEDQHHYFIGRDITDRIRLEQQLRQAQRMESIGQLTGGIAHDFNNLLTVIIGMTEALDDIVADDDRLAGYVRAIDEAAERGATLTQRMLAYASNQPLHAEPLDVNHAVVQTVDMLERTLGADIDISILLAPGLWPAMADQSQLREALLNLAINARDAMPEGGKLVIETRNASLDKSCCGPAVGAVPGDYVMVSVTDTGTGMPPEVLERAFDPFFTTKEAGMGTGLGLSMIYGFAKQLKGHVKICSEVGHGTSVVLYLPRTGTAAPRPADGAPGTTADPDRTILVVEDDPSVRAVAVTALKGLGYVVLQAPHGPAALEILEGGDRIDLLFTDMIMPEGMTGAELASKARLLRPGLKVLYASGYSEHFIDNRGLLDATARLLNKPYRKLDLALAVEQALDPKAAA